MANNYSESPRLQEVAEEKQATLAKTDALYKDLIQENQQSYDKLIDGAKDYAQEQETAQQAAGEQSVAQLEQDKAQMEQDYAKEQAAAYGDYQKQVNPYGVEDEKLAAGGLSASGYSESAKVSMYNAYQNRVAVAKVSYDQAVREYDMAIQEAKRLNSAALAQIAYDSFVKQTELALKSLNQYTQLKFDWDDRRWEQQTQFRKWEEEIWKQLLEEQGLAAGS